MMTNETSRPVRWLVIAALTAATIGMFVISMRANYLYGRGIGQSPETKQAIAWANVGADLWKGFGLIVVAALWRGRRRRAALATTVTWLVCLLFSISSAIGIYVQERTALTGNRAAQHASYGEATKELAQLEANLKSLGQQRSPAEIQAAIAAMFARPVMSGERLRGTVGTLSGNCARHDWRTAQACAQIAELRQELATATEADRLEGRATALRQRVLTLRKDGAAEAPDPVGAFWAWLTRGFVTVAAVGFGLPLAFALMIEMVSAFGPLGIVAYAEATRRQAPRLPRDVVPSRDPPRHDVAQRDDATVVDLNAGRVVEFMAERTEPTASPAAITGDELHADYALWCHSNGLRGLQGDAFIAEFDRVRDLPELAGKVRKFGNRYYGIRLVDYKIARLPMRKRDQG